MVDTNVGLESKICRSMNHSNTDKYMAVMQINKGHSGSSRIAYNVQPRLFAELDWDNNLNIEPLQVSYSNSLEVYPSPAHTTLFV